jgi:ketosteroid isomerase-like protein
MSTEIAVNRDPIFAYRQKFVEAFKVADVDTIVSLAGDDAVIMSPNDSTLYGRDEWRDWLEEYFQYFRCIAYTEPDRAVSVQDGFATEYSTYMIAIAPVGGASRIRDDGRFFTIWKQQPDGEWKIWQMMWNSTKPIGIGTNRYMWRFMQKKKGRPKR